MEIKTKYNLGDMVYPVSEGTKEVKIPCSACNGVGEISLSEDKFNCPKCYGKGYTSEWLPRENRVYPENIGMIGKIEVVKYDKRYQSDYNKSEVRYMLSSTGVGSGTLWKEENLLPSIEEAEQECNRRNREKGKTDEI